MRRLLALASLALVCAPLGADRLVTSDGRILVVKHARKLPDGNYRLDFENGPLLCPERFVKSVEIEGDMSDYVPQNEDEKKKLEQGFVRFGGKWMSAAAYQAELNKQAAERRSRIDELAAHADFYNAYRRETKHFDIRSNTSKELLDYYANLLEAYYDLMDKRVGINPTPTLSRTKMRVNIYKNREDWEQNNNAGAGGGVIGYFSFLEETLNFFYDYPEPSLTNWVALHECTHLLTYLIDPQAWSSGSAIWVNEGVADFFGSADIQQDAKGRIQITPGKLQVDRILTVQQAIKDDDYVHLETLFHTSRDGFGAFEYAHAWSFIYFLNNSTKQYESGFRKFFKDFYTTPKGVPFTWEPFPNKAGTAKVIPADEVRKLLLDAIKVKDVQALEKEWISFVSAIKIDGPEALFKRAYTVLRQGDDEHYADALKDVESALASGFADPRAHWVRGLLRASEAEKPKAGLDDLRKAVELAPLDANFRSSLAQSLAGRPMISGGFVVFFGNLPLSGTDEEIEEAREQYGLACELAPDNEFFRTNRDEFMTLYEKRKTEGTPQK